MCGRKTILNNRDRRSMKRLAKSYRQKSPLELTNNFYKGRKTISTCTMRRELKVMGLKSLSAARKSLVTATNRKRDRNLPRNVEIRPLINDNKSYGQMNPYLLSSNTMVASGLEEEAH
ncbi:hypothetical protein AVEN_192165-1 [Araneus ventricosus]|uniref:Transposase Tc1-like domain-containing protein n=1 Tax=Araneus ventricosus TaxID=182803 RepID=A0A4Y2THZ8_ARAVE|nr:hypothetical protein AVEN_192165-1 [Araneus ventricosus]